MDIRINQFRWVDGTLIKERVSGCHECTCGELNKRASIRFCTKMRINLLQYIKGESLQIHEDCPLESLS